MHVFKNSSRNNPRLIALLVIALFLSPGLNAANTDPTTAPMPVPGFGSTERAWVFLFKYDADNPAALVASVLSDVPPSQRISAPPHIEVSNFDQFGMVIDVFNTAYPSWVSVYGDGGDESMEIQNGHTGGFSFPFSTEVRMVKLRDLDSGEIVLEIDTKPIILRFCAAGKEIEGDYCAINRVDTIFSSGFE